MWPLAPKSNRPFSSRSCHRRTSTYRPQLEGLEDRCTPSSAGALDPTFGNGAGYVTTALSRYGSSAYTTLIQPDGKIIAAGFVSTNNWWGSGLARYNSDGSLDKSFGSGGVVVLGDGIVANWAALYPSTDVTDAGKIVVEGSYNGQLWLERFNPNGSIDTTFGSNKNTPGRVPTTFTSSNTGPGGLVVTSSGQVVVATDNNSDIMLERFTSDGSVDTTFGTAGQVITPLAQGSSNEDRLIQQADGKGLVAGGTAGSLLVLRYNADGSLDTTFGGTGIVTSALGAFAFGAAVYPNAGTANDGRIVVAGFANAPAGAPQNREWLLERFNSDGTLDSTFGTAGVSITSSLYEADTVAVAADGKLVVEGYGSRASGYVLTRYDADGTQDGTFGSGGVLSLPFEEYGNSELGSREALQSNGDIIVVGTSGNGYSETFAVARYQGTTASYFTVTGPSSTSAGTPGTYTVSVFNPDGSADTGYSGTVHITSSDSQAALPADFTIAGGTATFSATLKTSGSQTLTATDTVTSSINGSGSGIRVNPASAAQFILSAPASVKSGAKFSLTLTVEDAYGNVAAGYTGTVHFTSSDGTATLPGDYTFTASDAGVHTFSNKAILRKRDTQTITVTDKANNALTITVRITVS